MMKRCFYEVLGINQRATEDEIKKSYRQLALKFHPDKNKDNSDDARIQFLAVQEAYETLSDPQERAWYDGHKTQILHGGDAMGSGDDPSAARLNIFRWFSKDCYDGFNESVDSKGEPKCFYTVYRSVFEIIADEEINRTEDSTAFSYEDFKIAPSFGTSTSSSSDINKFYRFWSHFSTQKNFAFADEWNVNEAPNRAIRRQMEVENKKKRKDARREFNDSVRALVEFVKKRDPRMAAVRMEKEVQAKRTAEEEVQRKWKLEEEKKRLREEALKEEQERWELIEKEKVKKKADQVFLGYSEEISDNDDDDEDAKSKSKKCFQVVYVCEACRKTFRSEAQFRSHEKSKKHQAALTELMREFEEQTESDDEDIEIDKILDNKLEERLLKELKNNEVEKSKEEGYESIASGLENESESKSSVSSDDKFRNNSKSDEELSKDFSSGEELLGRLHQLHLKNSKSSGQVNSIIDSEESELDEKIFNGKKKNLSVSSGDDVLLIKSEAEKRKKRRKNKKEKSMQVKSNCDCTQSIQIGVENEKLLLNKNVHEPTPEKCSICLVEFDSRNKLFHHIKVTGHAAFKEVSVTTRTQKKKKNAKKYNN